MFQQPQQNWTLCNRHNSCVPMGYVFRRKKKKLGKSLTLSHIRFMPTRDLARLPQELPFQGRDFHPTTVLPQFQEGGLLGYGKQVQVETFLRPEYTREPEGCITYEYRDWGSLEPLVHDVQRGDYRPFHQLVSSRNYIKVILFFYITKTEFSIRILVDVVLVKLASNQHSSTRQVY
jgi:hypothetical protein